MTITTKKTSNRINKIKNSKVLIIFFSVLILLLVVNFSPLYARTIKMLKEISTDVFNVVGSLVIEKDATIKGNLEVNGTMNIKLQQSNCEWIYVPGGGNGNYGYREQICPLGKYMAGYKNYRDDDWTRTGHVWIYCCKP